MRVVDLKDHLTIGRHRLQELIRNDDWGLTGRLLEDTPHRPDPCPPWATDRDGKLHSNKIDRMLGLISKYNWEYRRPYLYPEIVPLEHWSSMRAKDLPHGALQVLHDRKFRVEWEQLRQTPVWDCDAVADMDPPSSMMLPLWSKSAVGGEWVTDEWAMVRRVLAISFPRLCVELMGQYTAREIAEAWERSPIVCNRKPSGGPPGPGTRWTRWDRRRF